jgi:hypothetical protein
MVLNDDERALLGQVCADVGVPCRIIEKMIDAENQVYGMGRRHGIWESLEALVSEGIRDEEVEETSG